MYFSRSIQNLSSFINSVNMNDSFHYKEIMVSLSLHPLTLSSEPSKPSLYYGKLSMNPR